jgi:hypothetical protein
MMFIFFYIVPSSRHAPSTCLLRLIRRRTAVGDALSHGMVWFATALAPANPKSTPPYPGPFARCGDGFVEVGALLVKVGGHHDKVHRQRRLAFPSVGCVLIPLYNPVETLF